MEATIKQQQAEKRVLAALAHGSIVTQGVGILVGVLVYLNQRDKSKYVAYQGLQAALYQLFAMAIVIFSWILWTVLYMIMLIPSIQIMENSPNDAPPAIFWISMFSMIIPFMIMLVLGAYGVWGGIKTWQGKSFRYVIIGSLLETIGLFKNTTLEDDNNVQKGSTIDEPTD